MFDVTATDHMVISKRKALKIHLHFSNQCSSLFPSISLEFSDLKKKRILLGFAEACLYRRTLYS